MAGRPSDYTDDLVAAICGRLSDGEALSSICEAEDMPGLSTVYRWLQQRETFRELYARAREDQADTLADQILKIADESPELAMLDHGRNQGSLVVDGAAIQHQRLRIDARKWIASKLRPKKYGDKVDVEHAGTVILRTTPADEAI